MNTTHIERANQKTVLVTDYDYSSKLRTVTHEDIFDHVRKLYWQHFYRVDLQ